MVRNVKLHISSLLHFPELIYHIKPSQNKIQQEIQVEVLCIDNLKELQPCKTAIKFYESYAICKFFYLIT